MPFFKTRDEVSIFYNDWGTGRPVVLIHGWPLNADFWEPQSTFLAANGFRVIAYDRRGFGRSDQPWTGYDYDTLVDDLQALMTHLDLHDVTLVGFSMGGGEVARYLSRHGTARVAQAVLMSAVTPLLKKMDDYPDGIDQSVFDELIKAVEIDRVGFLSDFREGFFNGSSPDRAVSRGVLDWYLIVASQASLQATIACARAWSETDFRADLSAMTVPTLIMHGSADVNVPPEITAHVAASMIPTARYIEYAGSGHAIGITDRNEVNRDLLAFLQEMKC
ncbi:Pimeloyl-ACP methyl ester carboxylesterase [Burkholderia sp. YR290]|jgi:pimeloyl-ACP methyl ester carboxylesterase|nr:Pimeloyl-ACP methyl ester carboxylesterase [Burkholderia sp. YR290]